MLSKETTRLLEEVAGYFGEKKREMARKHPEACVFSLLRSIQERLPHISSTLYPAVDMAFFEDYIKEAEKLIEK